MNAHSVCTKPEIPRVEEFRSGVLFLSGFLNQNCFNKSILLKTKVPSYFIHIYKYAASIFCAKMIKESNPQYNELKLKCNRCQKIWKYAGSNPYYATCTFYKTSFNVRKNKVQVDNVADQANSSQPEQICEGDLS